MVAFRHRPIGTPLRGKAGFGRMSVTVRWELSQRRSVLVRVRLARYTALIEIRLTRDVISHM